MQLSSGSFRLATYSLTGNKKPGGSILHPHQQFFKEIVNLLRGHFGSTSTFRVSP
jgi:hypothetical protein